MPRKFAVVILFLSVIAAGIVWQKNTQPSLCKNLDCFLMKDSDGFTVKELYTDTKDAYRALYKNANRYIRIEARVINPSQKDAELQAAVNRMRALFEKAPAPYPGEISDAIVCDPAFIPMEKELKNANTSLTYFTGYLNNRMTFGSCSLDQAVYKGIAAYTYCPANNLYINIELFTPTEEFEANSPAVENQIRTLRCPD